jgi:hypothetical protein
VKRVLRWVITKLAGEQPDGFTAFQHTIWFIDNPSPGLVAHEALHVEQQRRDGALYYLRYAYELVRYGYRNVSYEVAAYAEQDRVNGR